MSSIQVLSNTIIHAPNHNTNCSNDHTIDLNPLDLQFISFGYNQQGFLYRHPVNLDISNQIQHLKDSFSSTLDFFYILAGRLKITQHEDNTFSCAINCNNEGALFVHAAAKYISVDDILKPTHLPPIHHSLFLMNGVKNYEGTSNPLLAVQVTELDDGIFLGISTNHVTGDGNLFSNFYNLWAKISRGCCLEVSKTPIFERWFPKGVECPIRFPLTIEPQSNLKGKKLNPPERIFHFTKENIVKLKLKANLEAGTKKISSLQAVLTHIWRSFTRSQKLDHQTDVSFSVDVSVRPRLNPPLQENYFGNAIIEFLATLKAGELLDDGGLGKGALKINEMIALHTDEKIRSHYEKWLIKPSFYVTPNDMSHNNCLVIAYSPRFDVYGNDFGWGKPVGVRSGGADKREGKVNVFAGVEEGSMEIEVCLPYEILEAMGNDLEFMDVVSS
ncbi:uncharacterized acetyltransferase At3g50280-like [Vicia villosa]|uniref:uncharacterized acetyltransferase At3g50280-like n=1 Tax=Vicia villosa TaxID=3911 RepID=UPI00273A9E00|nr:uncharacterized acetyltransferase At3g50280-like [Vicia villosa]